MSKRDEAAAVVMRLEAEHQTSVAALRGALKAFLRDGTAPDPRLRAEGAFTYPQLLITYAQKASQPRLARSYARFSAPGVYGVTITRPDLFADYLIQQLTL